MIGTVRYSSTSVTSRLFSVSVNLLRHQEKVSNSTSDLIASSIVSSHRDRNLAFFCPWSMRADRKPLLRNFGKQVKLLGYNCSQLDFAVWPKLYLSLNQRSFARFGAKLWNSYQDKFRQLPKSAFKKQVHDLPYLIMEAEDDYVETPIVLYKIANFT